jgi:hypothetical protein
MLRILPRVVWQALRSVWAVPLGAVLVLASYDAIAAALGLPALGGSLATWGLLALLALLVAFVHRAVVAQSQLEGLARLGGRRERRPPPPGHVTIRDAVIHLTNIYKGDAAPGHVIELAAKSIAERAREGAIQLLGRRPSAHKRELIDKVYFREAWIDTADLKRDPDSDGQTAVTATHPDGWIYVDLCMRAAQLESVWDPSQMRPLYFSIV